MNLFKSALFTVFTFMQVSSFGQKVKLDLNTYWDMSEFETLKKNYPLNRLQHNVQHFATVGKRRDIYGAHCAINLSEALLHSGFNLGKDQRGKCSIMYDCETDRAGQHVLMASTIANILKEKYRDQVVELTGRNYLDYVKGKKGIIYFENYWSRDPKEWELQKPTGDHIDLWDGNKLVSYDWAGTFVRNYLTNHRLENKGKGPSPLRQAEKVYFFEMD